MRPDDLDPFPPPLIRHLAAHLQALGEETRIRIVLLLKDGELPVGAVATALGVPQPTVSKHLARLAQAGIVLSRREAQSVHYRLADETLHELCDLVCNQVRRHHERLTGVDLDQTQRKGPTP